MSHCSVPVSQLTIFDHLKRKSGWLSTYSSACNGILHLTAWQRTYPCISAMQEGTEGHVQVLDPNLNFPSPHTSPSQENPCHGLTSWHAPQISPQMWLRRSRQNVSAKPADPLLCVGQLLSLRLRLGRVADCHVPTDKGGHSQLLTKHTRSSITDRPIRNSPRFRSKTIRASNSHPASTPEHKGNAAYLPGTFSTSPPSSTTSPPRR